MKKLNRGQELFAVLVLRSKGWKVKPSFHKQKVQALQNRGLLDSHGTLTDEGYVAAKQIQRRLYFKECARLLLDSPDPGKLNYAKEPRGYYPSIAFEDIRRFGYVTSGAETVQIFETRYPNEVFMIGMYSLTLDPGPRKVDEMMFQEKIFATIPRPVFERGGPCVLQWQELEE